MLKAILGFLLPIAALGMFFHGVTMEANGEFAYGVIVGILCIQALYFVHTGKFFDPMVEDGVLMTEDEQVIKEAKERPQKPQ